MKVFVQIPCLNEEQTLPMVLDTIPKELPGVDSVEVLIIDDGSTDRTVEVAKEHGVTHFVRHARNMGLARSFRDGVDYALAHGADIVVNTDGDNQYKQERIADLVAPVVAGEADIAIADRQTKKIAHFSPFKKVMQQVGSQVVNIAAETELPDAASGFRAYSKASLMRLNVITQFSYCMETIIQAGNKRLRIASVPIDTNPKTRESRLFNNIFQHMGKSGSAIVRAYLMFKPHTVLMWLAGVTGVIGLIPFVRFLVFALMGEGGGHIQSLIFGLVLLTCSFMTFVLMIIADLQRTNRVLIEEALERIKLVQYGTPSYPLVGSGATVPSSYGSIVAGGADGGAGAGPEYAPHAAATDGEVVVDRWETSKGLENYKRTQGE